MLQIIEANWLAFALALLIGLLVAWWLFGRSARIADRRERRPDVLDEGAAPAQRNQALIDAPPAASMAGPQSAVPIVPPAPVSEGMAGIGEVVAAAASEEADRVEPASPPPTAAAAAAPSTEGDDLRRIKGVGPKLVALLHSLGVTRYAQIAAWTDEDIGRMDAQLGSFAGRIRRDSWVEQAQLLAAGDVAGFEGKFGKV